ncbi:hypothetical protein EA462_10215 [Natrarchaeobius halalkaliphilus]|uniref:Uncharacterized protein n=1 Tax=Natrarchaeobius halalkaliphilus TaxID=1679091 RepID=A0A3N6NZF8_9EURY|nr:hypothetical protein [Natrarchaeobius halalkaliphilus]RQG90339.1 hypothetical protein EA462_10215 [Natrarchaeobius halalkaliphilus]
MNSRDGPADAGRTPRDLVCGRCGDSVPAARVIHLSSEPCPELTGHYESVTKSFCSDCVAAVGMLEFTAAARSRVESE